MLNVYIHSSTNRKSRNKYGLFGRVSRTKCLPSRKNMTAQLTKLSHNLFSFVRFTKLNKPQLLLNNVLWTDWSRMEMLGNNAKCHIW